MIVVAHTLVWTFVVVTIVDAVFGRRHRRQREAEASRTNLLRELQRHHPAGTDRRLSTLDPEGNLHDDVR